MKKRIKLTLDIERDGEWYVGQIRELPAVVSQGKTIEELKENILDALQLYLDTNKELNKNYSKETQKLQFTIE